MEAQTKLNYLVNARFPSRGRIAPDTTCAAVIVVNNYFYSDNKLFILTDFENLYVWLFCLKELDWSEKRCICVYVIIVMGLKVWICTLQ